MPYDEELISFLRRIDKNDDGVITYEELDHFLGLITLKDKYDNQFSHKGSSDPSRRKSPERCIAQSPEKEQFKQIGGEPSFKHVESYGKHHNKREYGEDLEDNE